VAWDEYENEGRQVRVMRVRKALMWIMVQQMGKVKSMNENKNRQLLL